MLSENPLTDSLSDVNIISQRHSVFVQKPNNIVYELEMKNAQLEWRCQTLSNEISKMSIVLKEAEDVQATLETANQTLTNKVKSLAECESGNIVLQKNIDELECRLERMKQSSRVEIDVLEESLIQTKIQGETEKKQLVLTYSTQVEGLESQLKRLEAELHECGQRNEKLQTEKITIETKFEDFRTSVANEYMDQGSGSDSGQSFLHQHVRTLQERNAELVADLRLRTNTVSELEKATLLKEEECAVLNRVKLRLESSVEAQQHEIALLEENRKRQLDDLKESQTTCDKLLKEKRVLEASLHEYSIRTNEHEAMTASLKERIDIVEEERRTHVLTIQNMKENEAKLRMELKINQDLSADMVRTKNDLHNATVARKELENALSQMKDVFTAVSGELAASKNATLRDIEALQSKHNDELDELHAAFELEREDYEDQLAALSQAFEKRGEVLVSLEKKVNVQSSEISFLLPELTRKDKKVSALEQNVKALKTDNEELIRMASQSSNRGAIINDLKADLSERMKLQDEFRTTSESLNIARMSVETLQMELKRVKSEYEILQEKHAEAQATIEELSATAAEEIDSQHNQISALNNSLEQKCSALAATSNRLKELSALYDALLHKHSELVDERADLLSGEY